jgi:heme/copper-type cytochrome/quinol oxidase subunit 2
VNFWEFMLALVIVMPIVVLWIGCLIDVIMRPDISGWSKLFWTVGIIFLPLFGSLVYIVVRPKTVTVTDPGLADRTWSDMPRGAFDMGTRVNPEFGSGTERPSEYPYGR